MINNDRYSDLVGGTGSYEK